MVAGAPTDKAAAGAAAAAAADAPLAVTLIQVKKTAFAESVRCASLGSRRNLCGNPSVLAMKSDSRMADACLDLQKNKKNKRQNKKENRRAPVKGGAAACEGTGVLIRSVANVAGVSCVLDGLWEARPLRRCEEGAAQRTLCCGRCRYLALHQWQRWRSVLSVAEYCSSRTAAHPPSS